MASGNPVDIMVGERLQARRLEKNLHVADFARSLGVSESQIEDWEAGAARVPSRILMQMIERLGVTVDALFSPSKSQIIQTGQVRQRASSDEALRLLRAFLQIEDSRSRARIVEIVETVSKSGGSLAAFPPTRLSVDREILD